MEKFRKARADLPAILSIESKNASANLFWTEPKKGFGYSGEKVGGGEIRAFNFKTGKSMQIVMPLTDEKHIRAMSHKELARTVNMHAKRGGWRDRW